MYKHMSTAYKRVQIQMSQKSWTGFMPNFDEILEIKENTI